MEARSAEEKVGYKIGVKGEDEAEDGAEGNEATGSISRGVATRSTRGVVVHADKVQRDVVHRMVRPVQKIWDPRWGGTTNAHKLQAVLVVSHGTNGADDNVVVVRIPLLSVPDVRKASNKHGILS
jgi:hypothetical protein